jgi:hypothetical protein
MLFIIPALIGVAIVGGIVIYDQSNPSQTSPFPFPCLPNEALLFHIHPYVRIIINGENISIPAAIGIRNPIYANGVAGGSSNSCFEPLHTHDSSGVIHIESGTNTTYTLGDFFKVWNATYGTVVIDGAKHPVVFNSTDILGFKADPTHKVVVLVDGKTSDAYGFLALNALNYCSSAFANVSPCYPTAGGNPYYSGHAYPYGTGHTILIEYVPVSG